MITKNISVEINIEPYDLAEELSNMSSLEQALFLNKLAEFINEWDTHYCAQLQAISDCPELTKEARDLMEYVGQYAQS